MQVWCINLLVVIFLELVISAKTGAETTKQPKQPKCNCNQIKHTMETELSKVVSSMDDFRSQCQAGTQRGPPGPTGTQGPAGPTGEQGPPGKPGSATGSATYVRWGRKECGGNATLIYHGITGGSFYHQTGGAANYLCLPSEPQWGSREIYDGDFTSLYGTEYEFHYIKTIPFGGTNAPQGDKSKLHEHDVPCARCETTRNGMMMIPGWNTCPSTWTFEYTGYLVSAHKDHIGRTEFVCVDSEPDTLQGGEDNDNGALMYIVRASCGALPCPPYVEGRSITCVVCTK